jgi:protein phosphatase
VEDIPVRPEVVRPARALVSIDFGGRTHTGLVRSNNEDNFHILQFGRYARTLASSLPASILAEEFDQTGYGFAVADGVGGHAAGEYASRAAIALLVELALATPDWIFGQESHLLMRVMERSAKRFKDVNQAIVAQAASQPALRGMGTTLSAALSLGDDLIVTHVGDSPVCLFRNGQLHRLTRDHTMEQMHPNPDALDLSRFRNVLSRAIGIPEAEPDIGRYKLNDGDRLLLCTDGLTDLVDADAIATELDRGTPADEVCRALVEQGLARGGRDNVTVVVATFRLPPAPQ